MKCFSVLITTFLSSSAASNNHGETNDALLVAVVASPTLPLPRKMKSAKKNGGSSSTTTTNNGVVTHGVYGDSNIPLPLDPCPPPRPSPTDRSCFGPEDCTGPCDGPEDCKIPYVKNPHCGNFPTCLGLEHPLCIDNACQSGQVGAKCYDQYDCIPPSDLFVLPGLL